MTANNRFHNYYWLLIKQIPSDQLRSIKRVQICIEVAHSSGSQSLCLHTTIPIWHTFYLLQLMLQQSIYSKMASLTPVACSFQSAAESAKSLHSILLCNKSNSCFSSEPIWVVQISELPEMLLHILPRLWPLFSLDDSVASSLLVWNIQFWYH